jgi:hypothetical protein
MIQRVDKADKKAPSMNDHFRTNISRRRRIICAVNLDMAVEVHAPFGDAIVFEPCRR